VDADLGCGLAHGVDVQDGANVGERGGAGRERALLVPVLGIHVALALVGGGTCWYKEHHEAGPGGRDGRRVGASVEPARQGHAGSSDGRAECFDAGLVARVDRYRGVGASGSAAAAA
jgi:hypothetical protein